MENVTKALIIAAAVLIAVLIISLGMYIINSVSESMEYSKSSMPEMQVQAFNSQFTIYQGLRKSASQVKQLLKVVASSNAINENKVAVKLSGLTGSEAVMDSCKYVLYDNNDVMIKCNASNIVPLDTITSYVDIHRGFYYDVSIYYCNPKSQKVGNNKELKPVSGCVLLINIKRVPIT